MIGIFIRLLASFTAYAYGATGWFIALAVLICQQSILLWIITMSEELTAQIHIKPIDVVLTLIFDIVLIAAICLGTSLWWALVPFFSMISLNKFAAAKIKLIYA